MEVERMGKKKKRSKKNELENFDGMKFFKLTSITSDRRRKSIKRRFLKKFNNFD